MEMLQTIVERRKGGETGVKAVRCIEGDAVWESGLYDPKLLETALSKLKRPAKDLRKSVPKPVLFRVEYADGLKASVLTLNHAVAEWSIAWRLKDGREDGTLFWTQEARPFMHFAYLVEGIERMMHTGRPSWPAERTLLSSGTLDALLVSKLKGARIETPYLDVRYRPTWDWRQPPAPPPDRPLQGR
jgi:hypothetical protein